MNGGKGCMEAYCQIGRGPLDLAPRQGESALGSFVPGRKRPGSTQGYRVDRGTPGVRRRTREVCVACRSERKHSSRQHRAHAGQDETGMPLK